VETGTSAALGPVVLIVRVDVPEALLTDDGLNLYDKGITSFADELMDVPVNELSNSVTIIEVMLTVVPTAEPEAFLEKQRVVLKGRPTVAGILLFADEPQAILAKRSAIKIFRYQTKSEGERDTLAFDPITIEGPIYDLIYKAVDTCKNLIESLQKLRPSGLESISYPEEALHENCHECSVAS
jgi:ATP-dependent DNA helicase RecG